MADDMAPVQMLVRVPRDPRVDEALREIAALQGLPQQATSIYAALQSLQAVPQQLAVLQGLQKEATALAVVPATLAGLMEAQHQFASDLSNIQLAFETFRSDIMANFSDLMAEVHRSSSVAGSLKTFVEGSNAKLDELKAQVSRSASPAEVQTTLDELKAANDAALSAIPANTPAASEPAAAAPGAVDPAAGPAVAGAGTAVDPAAAALPVGAVPNAVAPGA